MLGSITNRVQTFLVPWLRTGAAARDRQSDAGLQAAGPRPGMHEFDLRFDEPLFCEGPQKRLSLKLGGSSSRACW